MKFAWGISGLLAVALGLSAGCAADSSGPEEPPVPGILEVGSDDGEVVKIGGSYLLRKDQEVERLVVISGLARIEGTVKDEIVVIAGGATLAGSARVQGNVVVLGGTVEVEEGATVRGDLVVLGGGAEVPPGFEPGGEQVSIGTIPAGGMLAEVIPWFTQGLFLGRPIVPSLTWIWAVVAVLALLYLLINFIFSGPVHACAQALADKPLSVGLVGMLVLVLIAPLSLMLVVSVIGLVLIPFFWVMLLVAGLVGSVGVARWIGTRVLAEESPENRVDAARSLLIGLALITLVFMIPVLGFAAWSVLCVLALGAAATEAFAGLRRENPAAPSPAAPVPPPAPAGSGPVDDKAVESAAQTASQDERVSADDLSAFQRATFLVRLGAFLIDLAMVAFLTYLLEIGGGKTFLLFLIYRIAHWSWQGTTVGGIICRLRVVRTDGTPIRFTEAAVRGLSSILSTLVVGLGWLWILWDPERQAWHDKIAGTLVVRVPSDWPR